MKHQRRRRLAAFVVAAALLSACGGDDNTDDGSTDGSDATTAASDTAAGDDTAAESGESTPEESGDTDESADSDDSGDEADDSAATGGLADAIALADGANPDAEFVWAHSFPWTSWDPIYSTTGGDRDWLLPVYDRLIYAAPDGSLAPMLAESWEGGDDGVTLTLNLRQDATFVDGTPFNAEAVKINLERASGEDSRIMNELAALETVTVVDDYTVELTVSGELGAFVSGLANKPGMMVSPTAIEAGTTEEQPAGVSPYTLVDQIAGDSAVFERTENYWDESAQQVATMTYKVIADEQVRLNALQSGEVHGAPLNPNQVANAESADLQLISGVSPIFTYLAFNSAMEPFDDVRVRQAINHAVDRVAIGEGLYEGFCTAQVGPWPSSSFAYSESIGDGLDAFPYDPERARELLAEAGYPDGFSTTAMSTNITGYVKLSEVIQSQLAEVGITLELVSVPPAQFIEEFSVNKTMPMVVNGYPGAPDPDDVMKRLVLPGTVVNPGEVLPQDMIDLATEAATPIDRAERTPIYEQLMERFIEEPTHLMPMCMQNAVGAFAPGISNVAIHASGARDLRGVAVSGS